MLGYGIAHRISMIHALMCTQMKAPAALRLWLRIRISVLAQVLPFYWCQIAKIHVSGTIFYITNSYPMGIVNVSSFHHITQGSSNLSILSEKGAIQAERCKMALADMHFDQYFSSSISCAKANAEIIWKGKEEPLVFLDSLKEAHLYFLEDMKNGLLLSLLK